MINYTAILILNYPGTQWAINDNNYDTLDWLDSTPKPTQAELDALWGPLLAERARTAYIDLRAAEYPPIGDQLDALWKGGDAAAEMLVIVQAVKVKYPKSS
jgi:hypothetical protein